MLTFRGRGSLARARAEVAAADAPTELRIVAWENPRGGGRHYVVGTYTQLCRAVAEVPRETRHAYEILGDWLMLSPYVDAECVRNEAGTDDEDIDTAARELANALAEFAGEHGAWSVEVALLIAHRKTKASYHIVVVARDVDGARMCLPSAAAVGEWVTRAVRGTSDRARSLIDPAVWSSENRNFRLPFATKAGRPDSCLVPRAHVVGTRGVDGFTTRYVPLDGAAETAGAPWVTGSGGDDIEFATSFAPGGRFAHGSPRSTGAAWGHLCRPEFMDDLSNEVMGALVAWWAPGLTTLAPRRGWWGYDPFTDCLHIAVLHGHCAVHARVHASNHSRVRLRVTTGEASQTCFNTTRPTDGANRVMRLPPEAVGSATDALERARVLVAETFKFRAEDLCYLWST
jgi:hypothetical protein